MAKSWSDHYQTSAVKSRVDNHQISDGGFLLLAPSLNIRFEAQVTIVTFRRAYLRQTRPQSDFRHISNTPRRQLEFPAQAVVKKLDRYSPIPALIRGNPLFIPGTCGASGSETISGILGFH